MVRRPPNSTMKLAPCHDLAWIEIFLFLLLATQFVAALSQLRVVAKIGVAGMLSVLFSETGPLDAAAEAIFAAKVQDELVCDPAPCRIVANYQTLVQPLLPAHRPQTNWTNIKTRFDGPVSQKTLALYQSVLDRETSVAADERAVFETVCRRYTAQVKGDKSAFRLQEQHRKQLIALTATAKQDANKAWRALLDHLKEAKIRHRPLPGPETFLVTFREHGFPEEERVIMHDFGLSDEEIETVRKTFLEKFDPHKAPRTFEAIATQAMWINNYNKDIESCTCASLK